jgi:hypothetical protein
MSDNSFVDVGLNGIDRIFRVLEQPSPPTAVKIPTKVHAGVEPAVEVFYIR